MCEISNTILTVIVGIVCLAIGLLIGYILRKNTAEKTIGSAEQMAKNLILDAENRSESIKKEITLEAKEEAHRLRSDVEREVRERRSEISKAERRLIQKEEAIDKKTENLEKREEGLHKKEQKLDAKAAELDGFIAKQIEELERISGYSVEDAKQLLKEAGFTEHYVLKDDGFVAIPLED